MTSINICNFNDFIQKSALQNYCGHTTLNINWNDFEVIGDLYDERIGTLNYISISSPDPNQIFIGCYPYVDCKVLKCKVCGMLVLSHINDGGVMPRPEYFLVEKGKTYLHEPATKSVRISTTKLNQFMEEFPVFSQQIRDTPTTTQHLKLVGESVYYILNFREETAALAFDIVADRQTLINVNNWVLKNS